MERQRDDAVRSERTSSWLSHSTHQHLDATRHVQGTGLKPVRTDHVYMGSQLVMSVNVYDAQQS